MFSEGMPGLKAAADPTSDPTTGRIAEEIPRVEYAIIGGSGTFSIEFPEDLERSDVRVLARDLVFATPYGPSPRMKLFECDGKKALTVRMHGWRPPDVTRAAASQQLFWVLREAGVRHILVEGGVGSINPLLELRDFVVVDDYIDQSMRKDVGLGGPYLLIMRQAICPRLAAVLADAAFERVERNRDRPRRVFRRGVYLNTDGRHFESPAEIRFFRGHADVVGQSLCPEVYLAREIGACYAGLYMVTNYAEGVIRDWEHRELADIFYEESKTVGNILLDALANVKNDQSSCGCSNLRKPTLLVEHSRPKI